MGAGLIVVPVILGYRTGGDGQTTALKIPNEIKTLNAMSCPVLAPTSEKTRVFAITHAACFGLGTPRALAC